MPHVVHVYTHAHTNENKHTHTHTHRYTYTYEIHSADVTLLLQRLHLCAEALWQKTHINMAKETYSYSKRDVGDSYGNRDLLILQKRPNNMLLLQRLHMCAYVRVCACVW